MVWTVSTRTTAADLVRVAPMGVDTRHLLILVIATTGEAALCQLFNLSPSAGCRAEDWDSTHTVMRPTPLE